jgi:hypothetical protein
VVTECTTDPQGRSWQKQRLLIRRGNCDPVTVMEAAPSAPVPGEQCRVLGESRSSVGSSVAGVFQHMAVLPDGSGLIFEVTTQVSLIPSATPQPPEEGIFFVRADGSGLRRLGPAGRVPVLFPIYDGAPPIGITFFLAGSLSVSPDGRQAVLIDLGPDTAGHEAPQIFLLDLRSGRRTQLTHQSQGASGVDPGLQFARFVDKRTIGFYGGSWILGTFKSFRVKTDGSGLEDVPAPTPTPGARVLPQFAVTGTRSRLSLALFIFPYRQPVNASSSCREDPVGELFLVDGENLVQLTNFGRWDTGLIRSFIVRGGVLFTASANPTGENLGEILQLFSLNTRGGDLRQLTHLPADRPREGCLAFGGACGIDPGWFFADQVTGTVLFASSCDPLGRNPFGSQVFAMRPDGTGLRQLTATRGMTIDPDGRLHVEMPGPIAYPLTGER